MHWQVIFNRFCKIKQHFHLKICNTNLLISLFIGVKSLHKKTMYFYTDHDMSRGDKKVSTIVSLMAVVCVGPCVSLISPQSRLVNHAGLYQSEHKLCMLVCVYLNTFSYILTLFPVLILPRSLACMCCYCSLTWCVLVLRLATHSTWILIQPALQFSSFSMH